jgi:hypothetical protein
MKILVGNLNIKRLINILLLVKMLYNIICVAFYRSNKTSNKITGGINMKEKEINAQRLRQYYDTHKKRKQIENICNGRSNWNSCDYVDYNLQDYSNIGCLCWKQDGQHKCCRLVETIV